jgi:hypothetical protein
MFAFPENEQLRLQYMGKLGPNEFLLRLAKDSSTNLPAEFSSELGLTTREGEVLAWLSKGKTNRDIAQILRSTPSSASRTAPPLRQLRPAPTGAIHEIASFREVLRLIGVLLSVAQSYSSNRNERRSADFAPHHSQGHRTLNF